MKRRITGLSQADLDLPELAAGLYLARVTRARYASNRGKPYFEFHFLVLAPPHVARSSFSARLYSTPKALWKLNWFLRDFGYDADLLGSEEVDDKALVDLIGVLKISYVVVSGRSYVNLDAFAASGRWVELSSTTAEVSL